MRVPVGKAGSKFKLGTSRRGGSVEKIIIKRVEGCSSRVQKGAKAWGNRRHPVLSTRRNRYKDGSFTISRASLKTHCLLLNKKKSISRNFRKT